MDNKTFFENYLENIKDDFDYKLESLSLDVTEKILETMEKKNISRKQLADSIGVNRSSVSRLLNQGSNITIKRLLAIAEALDHEISIDFKKKQKTDSGKVICFKEHASLKKERYNPSSFYSVKPQGTAGENLRHA